MFSLKRFLQTFGIVLVLGLIWWLLFFLLGQLGLPQPFAKVAYILLMAGGVCALISLLLDLIGYPLWRWKE